MRTKVVLVLAAVLMLVISTVAIGSNMGFKISISLNAGYRNFVALPFYNQYTDANSVFIDIPGCQSVNRWDNVSGAWQSWNGSRDTNFTLNKGEALLIQMNTSTNWVVVGSHDPSFGVPMTAGYRNLVSVPYHTTARTANDLIGQIPNCQSVNRWDNVSGAWQTWNGSRDTNFSITPGEGILVQMNSTTSWTPAHY